MWAIKTCASMLICFFIGLMYGVIKAEYQRYKQRDVKSQPRNVRCCLPYATVKCQRTIRDFECKGCKECPIYIGYTMGGKQKDEKAKNLEGKTD